MLKLFFLFIVLPGNFCFSLMCVVDTIRLVWNVSLAHDLSGGLMLDLKDRGTYLRPILRNPGNS